MFQDCINSTDLTNQMANAFFCEKITADNAYNDDVSFISTLRALVYPRLKDGERLNLYFNSKMFVKGTIDKNSDREVLGAMFSGFNVDNQITITSINSDNDSNKAMFDVLERGFCKENDRWSRLEKVTEFFRKSFYSVCFINPEIKSVVLFVEKLNLRKLHYLQCSIFALLPWYFDPEKGVTQSEMDLINSLREKTSDKYYECIHEFAEKFNFRDEYIRQSLCGFEHKYEEIQAKRIKEQIDRVMYSIDDLRDRLTKRMVEKRDLDAKLMGFMLKCDDGESEIMDYFLCNKKLTLNSIRDNNMTFTVTDYVSYFDEEMAKRVIDNDRSYVYTSHFAQSNISKNKMKKLMTSIFVDQKLKIKFCTAYTFSIGSRVEGLRGYDYPSDIRKVAIPNPHIDRYSCLGNYETEINRRIMENDYVGAIELCVASCKSLNFGDSAVMERFMESMYVRDTTKFIELPDGTSVTKEEAIKWIEQEESKDE